MRYSEPVNSHRFNFVPQCLSSIPEEGHPPGITLLHITTIGLLSFHYLSESLPGALP